MKKIWRQAPISPHPLEAVWMLTNQASLYACGYISHLYGPAYTFNLCGVAYNGAKRKAPMDQIGRTPKQIGAIVRRERRRQSLSQTQLGARIRLRQATISSLEAGSSATQLQTLLEALAALDLEIVVRPRSKASKTTIEEMF